MSRKRRIPVAYVAVESPEMRIFMAAASGDPDRPRRVRDHSLYWCGADKPDEPDKAMVYDNTPVPEGAECCECGISIRELQKMTWIARIT